jgi:hypothetical protein
MTGDAAMKKELPVLSVVLYIAAILTAVGASAMAFEAISDIIEWMGMGFLPFPDSLTYIVFMLLEGVMLYYALALLMAAAGMILQNTATAAKSKFKDGDE